MVKHINKIALEKATYSYNIKTLRIELLSEIEIKKKIERKV